MRKSLKMTFIKGVNRKGYMGHWGMNYHVSNVIDIETNELLAEDYVFEQSTVFKGKKFSLGDTILMDVNVDKDSKTNKLKLTYYRNVRKEA